jgi:hypothetical protein
MRIHFSGCRRSQILSPRGQGGAANAGELLFGSDPDVILALWAPAAIRIDKSPFCSLLTMFFNAAYSIGITPILASGLSDICIWIHIIDILKPEHPAMSRNRSRRRNPARPRTTAKIRDFSIKSLNLNLTILFLSDIIR